MWPVRRNAGRPPHGAWRSAPRREWQRCGEDHGCGAGASAPKRSDQAEALAETCNSPCSRQYVRCLPTRTRGRQTWALVDARRGIDRGRRRPSGAGARGASFRISYVECVERRQGAHQPAEDRALPRRGVQSRRSARARSRTPGVGVDTSFGDDWRPRRSVPLPQRCRYTAGAGPWGNETDSTAALHEPGLRRGGNAPGV